MIRSILAAGVVAGLCLAVSGRACPTDQRGWRPDALAALLDDVLAHYKGDPDRVYLTGLSMGGFGTWALAARHPDKFAAIAPICGGGDPATAEKLKDLPTWVFHGEQ